MKFIPSSLSGVFTIELDPKADERGSFVRTFCKNDFAAIGLNLNFVQINQSFNTKQGTFRGLHFQHPPHADEKLVRCVAGRVLDILVDYRPESPTYLQSFTIELSAQNLKMVFIPKGIAHGFLTLEDNSSLIYHHTEFYQPGSEGGLRYSDPKLNLKLPESVQVISERDKNYPLL